MKKLIAATSLVLPMLAACGGGGDGGPLLPTGVVPGTSAAAYDLTGVSIQVGATNVSLGGSPYPAVLPLAWTARRQGGLPVYYVTVHVVAAGSGASAVLNDGTRYLHRNCGTALTGCDATGQVTCTYSAVDGSARLGCDGITWRSLAPGTYDIVARACFLNERLDTVCRGDHGANRDRFVQRVSFS